MVKFPGAPSTVLPNIGHDARSQLWLKFKAEKNISVATFNDIEKYACHLLDQRYASVLEYLSATMMIEASLGSLGVSAERLYTSLRKRVKIRLDKLNLNRRKAKPADSTEFGRPQIDEIFPLCLHVVCL